MVFGMFRCPACGRSGHVHDDGERFSAPVGRGLPPRACLNLGCYAKLWVRCGRWPLRWTSVERIDSEWNAAKSFAQQFASSERGDAPYGTQGQRLRFVRETEPPPAGREPSAVENPENKPANGGERVAFLRRKKQRQPGIELGSIGDEAEPLMQVRDAEALLSNGEFDLSAFTGAVFTGGLLTSARLLIDMAGDTAEKFWHGSNLDDQWEKGSREEREDAFKTAMRFQNALDDGDYGEDPQFLTMHAALRLKALLLATGLDATYRTDLLERIASDPMQFGVQEFGGS